MFTGIISYQGIFKGYRRGKEEIAVEAPPRFLPQEAGESLALDGVCLSLTASEGRLLFFNLSEETIRKTTLGSLRIGQRLNIELPLTLQSPLSGHLVTGHIDGKGKVLRVAARPPGRRVTVSFPSELRPYLIPKGSVALNGVSLTVAQLRPSSFDVELIPVTIDKSNLKSLRRGQEVNLECDILGKYVYNWLSRGKAKR
jgi:riboflavin synthase